MKNLFERDYLKLDEEELSEWKQQYKAAEAEMFVQAEGLEPGLNSHELPAAVRHYQELFPNHFLDIISFRDNEKYHGESLRLFSGLLTDPAKTERDILAFINVERQAYFLIATLLDLVPMRVGHHGAFLFKEFALGNDYVADYLLIGRGSGGHKFLFVELESPSTTAVLQNGEFGDAFRKGKQQAEAWRRWLPTRFDTFRGELEKPGRGRTIAGHQLLLPDEFSSYDESRYYYAVVAGRRSGFLDLTYRVCREQRRQSGIEFFHYDNLVDSARELLAGKRLTW